MAAWFIPAVKAILPLVSPIVASALPVFTTRKTDVASEEESALLKKQIAELQSAASHNAQHVKELAEQLQRTVAALESGAAQAEARFQRMAGLASVALGVSLVAVALALYAVLGG